MTSRYGYAPRGERAVDHAPKHGGQNLTLIAAISLRGSLAPRVLTGALGGAEFLHWVSKDLAPTLWPGAVVKAKVSAKRAPARSTKRAR